MNKIRIIASSVITVGLAAVAIGATAAPASAQAIKSSGTATRAESNKIHRGVDKQYCLTVKETQKIVGTKGKYTNDGEGMTSREFKGAKGSSVQAVYVYFNHGCAWEVDTDLTHDRWQSTYNDSQAPSFNWDD